MTENAENNSRGQVRQVIGHSFLNFLLNPEILSKIQKVMGYIFT